MVWIPDGEKNLRYDYSFDSECDRQTGRQTDGHHITALAALA